MTTYRYRQHIRWISLSIPILLAPSGITLVVLGGMNEDTFLMGEGAALLAMGALIWWVLSRMAATRVSIGRDELLYEVPKGTTRIAYSDITTLKFPSVRYLGGWVKILSSQPDIRLTVVVSGIGELLIELKEGMDRAGRSEHYDRQKFFAFARTATYSDHSWERAYENFWKITVGCTATTLLGMAIAPVLLDDSGVGADRTSLVVYGGVVSFIFAVCVYLTTEFISARAFARQADETAFACPPRNLEHEAAVNRKAAIGGGALYLISVIAILIVTG